MKVWQVIVRLATMPLNAEVRHLWDGETRTGIEHVWIARNGVVVTADCGELCYSTASRPLTAPTAEDARYWATPENSSGALG